MRSFVRLLLWLVPALLAICGLTAMLRASTPRAPWGVQTRLKAVGKDSPSAGEQWDVVDGAGEVIANSVSPSGWVAGSQGGDLIVSPPSCAPESQRFEVRAHAKSAFFVVTGNDQMDNQPDGPSGSGPAGGLGSISLESAGSDFWLAFPASFSPGKPYPVLTVMITASGPMTTAGGVTGTVAVPGQGFVQAYTLTPAAPSATVAVPVQCEMSTLDGTELNAVHVTSTANVQVQGLDFQPAASEGFMAMPSNGVGNRYVVPSYPCEETGLGGRLAVVATMDNTTVTVTPSVNVGSRLAGVPYTVVLSTGQAYELEETTLGLDLTGTIVTSDNNVVVFGGSHGADVPVGVNSLNPLTEELQSVDRWGTSYIVTPFSNRQDQGDVFRVVFARNNTTLSLNGTAIGTFQPGQFYDLQLGVTSQISADKPIMVAQYGTGVQANTDGSPEGDPSFTVVPSTSQFLTNVNFVTPSGFDENFITITTESAAVGVAMLDGVAVPAANYSTVGTSGFAVASIAIAPGPHLLTGGSYGVCASVYGYSDSDSYSYPGEELFTFNSWSWTPPGTPTNLVAAALSSSQIQLNWSDSLAPGQGFEIQRELTTGGTWSDIAVIPGISGSTAFSYTDTGLTPATAYNYRVRAITSDLDSAWSNVATATTFDVPPLAPSNLIATPLVYEQVQLNWQNNANNATGIDVQKSLDDVTWTTIRTLAPNANSYMDPGLSNLPSTIYYYRVGAFNAYGENFSNVASVTTMVAPPAAPTNLQATAPAFNQVVLTWSESTSPIYSFEIYRQVGGGAMLYLASVPGTSLTYTDNSVQGSTAYSYQIKATNAGGQSIASNTVLVITPPPPPPAAPSNLIATAVDYDEIDLTWQNNDLTQTNVVVQRMIQNGSWSTIATLGATATTYADTTVVASTMYSYRVYSFNSGGNSPYSNVAAATTLDGPPPGSTPYLRQIKIPTDFLIGGGTTTATAQLSMPATTPMTIRIWSPDSGISTPASIIVPTGQRSANFSVSVGFSAGINVGYVYGSDGSWTQKAKFASAGSADDLAIPAPTVTSGNGGVRVDWDTCDDDVYGNTVVGFVVYRSTGGGQYAPLTSSRNSGNSYIDSSATFGQCNYVVSLVEADGTVLASSPATTQFISTAAPSITWVSVPQGPTQGLANFVAQCTQAKVNSYDVFVDGVMVGSAMTSEEGGGNVNTIVAGLLTNQLANGQHTVLLASEAGGGLFDCSAPAVITVQNNLTGVSIDGISDLSENDLGDLAAQSSTGGSFTINIADSNGNLVRSWVGFGATERVAWDGTNMSGNVAPDGNYTISTTSGDLSPDHSAPINLASVKPIFLSLVTDADAPGIYFGTGSSGTSEMVSHIVRCMKTGRFGTNLVLAYKQSAPLRASEIEKIERWLGTSVTSFYFYGHGQRDLRKPDGDPNEFVEIGANVKLFNYDYTTLADSDPDFRKKTFSQVIMPNVVGGQPFNFVFLDACHQAGCNPSAVPPDEWGTYMTRNGFGTAFRWMTVFNVEPIPGSGAFFAWNGQDTLCNTVAMTQGGVWLQWREYFWDELSTGHSLSEAISSADVLMLGSGNAPDPWSVSELLRDSLGDPVPKRFFVGDFQW